VFIAVMALAMPIAKHTTGVAEDERLFLIFLSVLLRIWATVGELMLAGVAYAMDWKGATTKPVLAAGVEEKAEDEPATEAVEDAAR
jgi:hypothetical protein